jgi:hypothetical protein
MLEYTGEDLVQQHRYANSSPDQRQTSYPPILPVSVSQYPRELRRTITDDDCLSTLVRLIQCALNLFSKKVTWLSLLMMVLTSGCFPVYPPFLTNTH